MLENKEVQDGVNRAFLVGVELPGSEDSSLLLDELMELVRTLGVEIGGVKSVKVRKGNAAFLMGSGKAEEILEEMEELGCDLLVFDNELTPAQQRNWEELLGRVVVDRQRVILDIFAQRAQTREAVLQVALARQEYFLPRLKQAWSHLSRQKGGGAMARGMGEKQIEMDERMVRDRISSLKRELKEVVKQRETQRRRRKRVPLPTAAIVGYTNAGKSSLLNCLTGSSILAEDKLFATLDPTTRRLELPGGQIVLLTDTVGFVRRLPHRLVEAFKATLEEAIHANFLIHVADITSPDLEHHMETTLGVVKELGSEKTHIITVFNKVDAVGVDEVLLGRLKAIHPEAVFVSAITGDGIDSLLREMEAALEGEVVLMELLIPHNRYDVVHQLHEMGAVKREKAEDEGVRIVGNVPKRLIRDMEEFRV